MAAQTHMVTAMGRAVNMLNAGDTKRAASILRHAGFQLMTAYRFIFQPSFRVKMFALFS